MSHCKLQSAPLRFRRHQAGNSATAPAQPWEMVTGYGSCNVGKPVFAYLLEVSTWREQPACRPPNLFQIANQNKKYYSVPPPTPKLGQILVTKFVSRGSTATALLPCSSATAAVFLYKKIVSFYQLISFFCLASPRRPGPSKPQTQTLLHDNVDYCMG